MDLQPSARQSELIATARRLARERFAPRAERHDREASFPFDDYVDLRAAGLLGLCVPTRHGGLGADYETYCLVAEQLAQGNASTALTFNMHCLTMLMMGVLGEYVWRALDEAKQRPRFIVEDEVGGDSKAE